MLEAGGRSVETGADAATWGAGGRVMAGMIESKLRAGNLQRKSGGRGGRGGGCLGSLVLGRCTFSNEEGKRGMVVMSGLGSFTLFRNIRKTKEQLTPRTLERQKSNKPLVYYNFTPPGVIQIVTHCRVMAFCFTFILDEDLSASGERDWETFISLDGCDAVSGAL